MTNIFIPPTLENDSIARDVFGPGYVEWLEKTRLRRFCLGSVVLPIATSSRAAEMRRIDGQWDGFAVRFDDAVYMFDARRGWTRKTASLVITHLRKLANTPDHFFDCEFIGTDFATGLPCLRVQPSHRYIYALYSAVDVAYTEG